jgi:hypothetical protein
MQRGSCLVMGQVQFPIYGVPLGFVYALYYNQLSITAHQYVEGSCIVMVGQQKSDIVDPYPYAVQCFVCCVVCTILLQKVLWKQLCDLLANVDDTAESKKINHAIMQLVFQIPTFSNPAKPVFLLWFLCLCMHLKYNLGKYLD